MTITDLVTEAHALAHSKGWWDKDYNIPEKLCLIHSEVSEALESYRRGEALEWLDAVTGKPEGLSAELADVVIRVADLCGALDIDLEAAVKVKHEYNKTRPYRHGGKRA